ncbi:MAG: PH domain-containing protein [Anaerolineales bacterium]|nr:PH domain-containing protein [Anaerolineales bacterium]
MQDRYLTQLLGTNEKPILVTRQHWLVLLAEIITEVILTIFTFALITYVWVQWVDSGWIVLAYLLLSLPLVSLTYDVLMWRSRKYVVTNRRVIHMFGLISKHVIDSSLEKVNDVKMVQSAWGRLFKFGDVEILTASELGVNRFTRIADPIRLKTAMLNAKARMDEHPAEGQDPMDIPALIARLARLREQGVLTEVEFQEKKSQLLARIN